MRSTAVAIFLALPLAARAQEDLAAQARKILETNCYHCHGKDGSSKGRFGYVLDVQKMAADKKIVSKKCGPVGASTHEADRTATIRCRRWM